jgi:hypothetical protein
MNFDYLINTIQDTHSYLQAAAAKAVNMPMTVRNWLIGCYIVEFEQNGDDKAAYGDNLMNELALKLSNNIQGISATNLRLYRQFYKSYPEFAEPVAKYFNIVNIDPTKYRIDPIHQTVSDKLIGSSTLKIILKRK